MCMEWAAQLVLEDISMSSWVQPIRCQSAKHLNASMNHSIYSSCKKGRGFISLFFLCPGCKLHSGNVHTSCWYRVQHSDGLFLSEVCIQIKTNHKSNKGEVCSPVSGQKQKATINLWIHRLSCLPISTNLRIVIKVYPEPPFTRQFPSVRYLIIIWSALFIK